MRRIIINADDLGMSAEVNAQIEKCINLGVVTSSTLMANAPEFEEGVRIAKQYTQVSVGVHLNIIEFSPLTNSDIFKKHGVVGEDGRFIEGAIFSVPIDEELRKAIFEEWDAQITKVENAGIHPTHVDSHQHVHTMKVLQDVLCHVMDKHRIKKVRRKIVPSIRVMLRARRQPRIVELDKSKAVISKKKNILYRRFHVLAVKFSSMRWNKVMASKYSMTDAFFSFRDFYANRDLLNLRGQSSTIELMCHPGNKPFNQESEVLMKDMEWLDKSFMLTSYHKV